MNKRVKDHDEYNFYNIGYDDYSTILKLAKNCKKYDIKYILNLYIDEVVNTLQIDIINSLVRLLYRDDNMIIWVHLKDIAGISFKDIFDTYQLDRIESSNHIFLRKY